MRSSTSAARTALHATLDRIAETLRDTLPVVYIRDLADPLGQYRSSGKKLQPGWSDRISRRIVSNLAATAYIGQSGTTTRINLAFALDPRAVSTMELIPKIQERVRQTILDAPYGKLAGSAGFRVDVTGDTPLYADMRTLRRSDFKVVAVAAVLVVFGVLLWLLRSPVQSLLLIAATLLTYIAAYGMAWLACYAMFGFPGLNWQIDFIFFIVILSLGQDYNIFVVTRIREEKRTASPAKAVATAIWRTGHVVSSCGIIMAATFASMLSGSLVVMRQFAVAFALGVLLDSFIIRPLVVPALILLLDRDRNRPPKADDTSRDKQSSTPELAGATG